MLADDPELELREVRSRCVLVVISARRRKTTTTFRRQHRSVCCVAFEVGDSSAVLCYRCATDSF